MCLCVSDSASFDISLSLSLSLILRLSTFLFVCAFLQDSIIMIADHAGVAGSLLAHLTDTANGTLSEDEARQYVADAALAVDELAHHGVTQKCVHVCPQAQ
jgi:hypothetical protein